MRVRFWVFSAVFFVAVAVSLGLLSSVLSMRMDMRLADRLQVAQQTYRLKMELAGRQLAEQARVVAAKEGVQRAVAGPTVPDAAALKTAAADLISHASLVAFSNAKGAVQSRIGQPDALLDDASSLPLAVAAMQGSAGQTVAPYGGTLYLFAAVPVAAPPALPPVAAEVTIELGPPAAPSPSPASSVPVEPVGALIVGRAIDGGLASELQQDTGVEVTFVNGDKLIASTLRPDQQPKAVGWVVANRGAPGFGRVNLRLVWGMGWLLGERFPLFANAQQMRATRVAVAGGTVVLSTNATSELRDLANVQVVSFFGLLIFALVALIWGFLLDAALARQLSALEKAVSRLLDGSAMRAPTDGLTGGFLNVVTALNAVAQGAQARRAWTSEPAEHAPDGLQPPAAPPDEELGGAEPAWTAPQVAETETTGEWNEEPAPEATDAAPATPSESVSNIEHSFSAPTPIPDDAVETHAAEPPRASNEAWSEDDVAASPAPEADSMPPSEETAEAAPWPEPPPAASAPSESEPPLASSSAWSAPPEAAPEPNDPPPALTPAWNPSPEPEPTYGTMLDSRPVRPREPVVDAPPPAPPIADALQTLSFVKPAGTNGWPTITDPYAKREEPAPTPEPEQPATPEVEAEEEHWREVHAQFLEVRARCNEPGTLSFERFAERLRKNRETLLVKHGCRDVRFTVFEKEGKAAIKATPVR